MPDPAPRSRRTPVLTALVAVTVLGASAACSAGPPAPRTPVTPSPAVSTATGAAGRDTAITITAGGRTFDASINDSQVSRDFLATLPRTLTWDRNAGIEYITELTAPMTETGPFYTDVEAGDIV